MESLLAELAEIEPVRHRPAHVAVADTIRSRIAYGTYQPRQRLPAERDLAEALGVGRTTLRAAIRVLNEERLLETVRGRAGGTFVVDRRGRGTKPRIARGSGQQMREAYEFRLALEPEIARWAAERADARQRGELRELVAEVPTSISTYRALDSRFHLALAVVCDNRYALEALRRAREEFFVWADGFFDTAWTPHHPNVHTSTHEHAEIAEAVVGGDGERAALLMAEHLQRSADIYAEIIRTGGL